MNKIEEMWEALAAYQVQADIAEYGQLWAVMCSEKTVHAAVDAAYAAAYAAAAYAAYAAAYAAAAAAVAAAAYAAYAAAADDAAEADRWAQKTIDCIKKITTSPAQPAFVQEPLMEPEGKCKECLTYNGHQDGCSHATPPAQPAPVPLTDEQVDAATKAWFENDIVAGRNPFEKRMRAAFAAAHGITKGQP